MKSDSLYRLLETHGKGYHDSLLFKIHLDLGYYDPSPVTALQNSQMALTIAQRLGNSQNEAEALELIAANNRIIGNKTAGFEASFQALAIYDKLDLPQKEASLLLQIGTQYTADENYDEGVKYLKESLVLTKTVSEHGGENYVMINLGETYRLMGQLDSALHYNQLVLDSEAGKTDEVIRAYTEGNTGMVLHEQGRFERAAPLLQRSIQALSRLGDLYSASVYQADLGELNVKRGRSSTGLQMIREALDIAMAQGLKEQIRDFSQKLSEYYANRGDFAKAYPHQLRYAAYRDSLVNADNIRKVAETRYGYELDKKEQEVENLALKNELQEADLARVNTRLFLFIILALSLLILAILLYLGNKRKKAANRALSDKNSIIQEQSEQKELLHRELHHRVKNNLQLIGSIMALQSSNTTEESVSRAMKEGKSRVEALMLIHQNLYKEQHISHVNFKNYLEKLCQNLLVSYPAELDTLQMNSANVEIKTDDIIPLGLIVNEAVANAVKHRGNTSVSIDISFKSFTAGFELNIQDNGPGGLDLDKLNTGDGFGTKLIKTLSRQLRGELSVNSSEQGTRLIIRFDKSIATNQVSPAA